MSHVLPSGKSWLMAAYGLILVLFQLSSVQFEHCLRLEVDWIGNNLYWIDYASLYQKDVSEILMSS